MYQLDSKIIKVCDLGSLVIPRKYTEIRIPETAVADELEQIRQDFQFIKTVNEPVRADDFICLTSHEKTYTLNTAFSGETEIFDTRCCLGHKPGDMVILSDQEQWTITAVKRKLMPPLDDSLACCADVPEVKTLEELKGYLKSLLIEEEKRRMFEEVVYWLSFQLVKESEYCLDPNEIELISQRQRVELQRMSDTSGIPILNFLSEVMKELIGSDEEVTDPEAAYYAIAEQMLKTILLGSWRLNSLGGKFTDRGYRSYIIRRAEENKESVEDTEARIGIVEYLFDKCQLQVSAMVRSWVKENIIFHISEE